MKDHATPTLKIKKTEENIWQFLKFSAKGYKNFVVANIIHYRPDHDDYEWVSMGIVNERGVDLYIEIAKLAGEAMAIIKSKKA